MVREAVMSVKGEACLARRTGKRLDLLYMILKRRILSYSSGVTFVLSFRKS